MLQGVAVSGKRISQGPPGNVVALGCPPPPRTVSEQSIQISSSRNLTAWKLLPNISRWVLQTIEKGYQYISGLARPGLWLVFSTEQAPQQVLVMDQEVKALLETRAIYGKGIQGNTYLTPTGKPGFTAGISEFQRRMGGCVPF